MTTDEKLAAILAAVQTDPGNRGLARDPHDNLFTTTEGDFQTACRSIAEHPHPSLDITTGFFIPSATPPAFETDGPLGAVFLLRTLTPLSAAVAVSADTDFVSAVSAALKFCGYNEPTIAGFGRAENPDWYVVAPKQWWPGLDCTHIVAIEKVGQAGDGRYYSMRGQDISTYSRADSYPLHPQPFPNSIGIGDGGNEIGMGKIPHETIVKNIPNGDFIHCRVPTDHLIVCGVSNWGAYALAAGVYVLRGVKPPGDLFDPDREREILEVMVREGPLVDGVTGQQTATVDGLSWDEYAAPLLRIREILET